MSNPYPNPYPDRYFNKNEFACLVATTDQKKENKDISKNCDFYDRYSDMNQREGLFRDSENLYTRGWFQTINMIIAILFLSVQIYRETKKK
jgi:meiotically up-regulated gene 157 (Mug157) protein